MITGARRVQVPTAAVVLLAVALLVVGYGDGLAGGLQSRFNLPSPWIVTFSILVVLLAGFLMVTGQRLAAADVQEAEAVLWLFGVGLALQLLVHGAMNVVGYLQLAVFVVSLWFSSEGCLPGRAIACSPHSGQQLFSPMWSSPGTSLSHG